MGDGVLVSEVRVRGRLSDHAVGFAQFLAGQGYTTGSVRCQLHLVAQLSRWLDGEGLDVTGLTELEAERFIAARRARVRRLFRSRRALDPLISYLTAAGVLAAPVAVPAGPAAQMVDRYRRYLLVEPGLTTGTAQVYVDAVRAFVASFATDGRAQLDRMTAADVSAFVLAEANRRQGTSIRSVATALRSLLGFLPVEGLADGALIGAVPGVGRVAVGRASPAARAR
jgi:integrase/recombinase XerD